MPFYVLKTGPSFFCFFCFLLSLKISFSLEKEEDFLKKAEKHNNGPILVLKTGPIMLRNMLGPVFNTSLDQF